MPDLTVTTGLQEVQEADEIALHIGTRVLDGVSNTRLRRHVQHDGEAVLPEQRVDRLAISEINLVERKLLLTSELGEPVLFELDAVVVAEVIETDHIVAALQKRFAKVITDEPCSSRDKIAHGADCIESVKGLENSYQLGVSRDYTWWGAMLRTAAFGREKHAGSEDMPLPPLACEAWHPE